MNAERGTRNEEGAGTGGMPAASLRQRVKTFALRVIRLYASLENDTVSQVLGRQLLRSATSVGAHHREASRSRSVAEFVSKLEGGLQELDESAYWMELLVESNTVPAKRLAGLMDEADQLVKIFVASVKTAKVKRRG